jgi:molybdopterin converting factor small subunit
MQIQLEVFGTLRDKLKDRLAGGRGTIEVADGSTIDQLAEQLEIPIVANCVVMVNGQTERDRGRPLPANAKLTLIPPVAGG